MTRPLTAGMQAAVAAQIGTATWLIEIGSSGGTTYITNAPVDILWNAQVYTGVGGELSIGGIVETADVAGQGTELTLSGVSQTIIALILNNNVFGRDCTIRLVHVASDGTITADPTPFSFVQMSDYTVRESSSRDGATCTVSTRIVSKASLLEKAQPVRTNVHSHNAMLSRAGLPTGDTFFQHVPELQTRRIFWGGVRAVSFDQPSPGDRS